MKHKQSVLWFRLNNNHSGRMLMELDYIDAINDAIYWEGFWKR